MSIDIDSATRSLDEAYSLARHGQADQAMRLVCDIRSQFGVDSHPGVAAHVMLIEALIANYRSDWTTASDRLMRARHIAHHFNQKKIEKSISAWSAVVAFNKNEVDAAINFAADVFRSDLESDHISEARAASLVGAMYEVANLGADAARWFAIARRSAELSGDRALVSVVVFDAAVTRVSRHRFNKIFRGESVARQDLAIEAAFARSASNYYDYSSIRIMPRLHALLLAQSNNLVEEYGDSLNILDSFFSSSDPLPDRSIAQAEVELSICLLGESIESRYQEGVLRIERSLPVLLESDDLAVAHHTLSTLYDKLASTEKSYYHREQSLLSARAFMDWQSRTASVLTSQLREVRVHGAS